MLVRAIKNTMKRVDNKNSSVNLLQGSVKFNPALQKEMEEREDSRRSMTTRDKVCGAASIHVTRTS